MKWRPWLVASIALALGGCDFAPRYAPPSVATPSKFKDETAGGGALPASGEWWLAFNDRTLNDLQAQVDAANPDLAAAVAANDAAVASANAALSAAYPQVDAVPHFLANKQSANRPLRSPTSRPITETISSAPRPPTRSTSGDGFAILSRQRMLQPKRARTRLPTRDWNCTPNSRATTSICAASTIRPSFFPIRSASTARR